MQKLLDNNQFQNIFNKILNFIESSEASNRGKEITSEILLRSLASRSFSRRSGRLFYRVFPCAQPKEDIVEEP